MSSLLAIPAIFGGGAAAGGAAAGGGVLGSLAKVGALAGTGLSAAAQIQQGRLAEQQGEMARDLAEQRALQSQRETSERTRRMTTENQRRLSAMRARMAAGGTTVSGSALDMLGESARRLQTKTSDAFYRGSMDARAERYSGEIAAFEGKQKKTAGALRGFGTLLEGVSAYGRQQQKWGYGGD